MAARLATFLMIYRNLPILSQAVLNRHESLAANLGAKLMGPRISRAMESIFDGQIKTTPPQSTFSGDSITWFDIVEFAKTKPNEFTLTNTPTGSRSCQFSLKGIKVEISENDWKVIISGAVNGFILAPRQIYEEDKVAKLVTLRVVKERLGVASGSGFQPINQFRLQANRDSDLYADLLQQVLTPALPSGHRSSSASSLNALTMAKASPTIMPQQPSGSRPSGVNSAVRDSDEENRALVTPKIEKLESGTPIQPHGKCGWKILTEEEMARLKDEASRECGGDGDESRAFGSGSQTGPYDPVRIRSWPRETTRV
ncbi:hypothetical protein DL766_005206 [Monosporascus sp. MC13-8B]|nr:hypothetical protein DL766_005206 [Monosporascus sp. MC13-8B]